MLGAYVLLFYTAAHVLCYIVIIKVILNCQFSQYFCDFAKSSKMTEMFIFLIKRGTYLL